MAKAPRENRVPIMLSDDELKAIDDYRFSKRIGTRSGAIRELVMLSLTREEALQRWIRESQEDFRRMIGADRNDAEANNV